MNVDSVLEYAELIELFKGNGFDVGKGYITRHLNPGSEKAQRLAFVYKELAKKSPNRNPPIEWSWVHVNKLLYGWIDANDPFSNFFSVRERIRLRTASKMPSAWRHDTFVHVLGPRLGFGDKEIRLAERTSERIDLGSLLLAWATQLRFDFAEEIDQLALYPRTEDKPKRKKETRDPFSVFETFANASVGFEGTDQTTFGPENVSPVDVGIYAKLCYLTFGQVSVQTMIRNRKKPLIRSGTDVRFDSRLFAVKTNAFRRLLRLFDGERLVSLIGERWLYDSEKLGYDPASKTKPKDFFSFGDSSVCSYRNAIDVFRKAWLTSCKLDDAPNLFYSVKSAPSADESSSFCSTARRTSDAIASLFPADLYYDDSTGKAIPLRGRVGLPQLYGAVLASREFGVNDDFVVSSLPFYDGDARQTYGDVTSDEAFLRLTPWQTIQSEIVGSNYGLSRDTTLSYEVKDPKTNKIEMVTSNLDQTLSVPVGYMAACASASDQVSPLSRYDADKAMAALVCYIAAEVGGESKVRVEGREQTVSISTDQGPRIVRASFDPDLGFDGRTPLLFDKHLRVTSCERGYFGVRRGLALGTEFGDRSPLDLLFRILNKNGRKDGACLEFVLSDKEFVDANRPRRDPDENDDGLSYGPAVQEPKKTAGPSLVRRVARAGVVTVAVGGSLLAFATLAALNYVVVPLVEDNGFALAKAYGWSVFSSSVKYLASTFVGPVLQTAEAIGALLLQNRATQYVRDLFQKADETLSNDPSGGGRLDITLDPNQFVVHNATRFDDLPPPIPPSSNALDVALTIATSSRTVRSIAKSYVEGNMVSPNDLNVGELIGKIDASGLPPESAFKVYDGALIMDPAGHDLFLDGTPYDPLSSQDASSVLEVLSKKTSEVSPAQVLGKASYDELNGLFAKAPIANPVQSPLTFPKALANVPESVSEAAKDVSLFTSDGWRLSGTLDGSKSYVENGNLTPEELKAVEDRLFSVASQNVTRAIEKGEPGVLNLKPLSGPLEDKNADLREWVNSWGPEVPTLCGVSPKGALSQGPCVSNEEWEEASRALTEAWNNMSLEEKQRNVWSRLTFGLSDATVPDFSTWNTYDYVVAGAGSLATGVSVYAGATGDLSALTGMTSAGATSLSNAVADLAKSVQGADVGTVASGLGGSIGTAVEALARTDVVSSVTDLVRSSGLGSTILAVVKNWRQ